MNDLKVPHDLYPEKLAKFIKKYPSIWYRGDLSLLNMPLVSVVGSREVSLNGVRRTRKLIEILIKQDFGIVSGLAVGVDRVAHTATLALSGKTIAVMGTPISEIYPKENLEIKKEIERKGLVLSQFEPGSPVQRFNFPKRNDLMAILADVTIVVEAGEGSGTKHQIESALKYGKVAAFTKSLVDSNISWVRNALEHKNAVVLSNEHEFIEHIKSFSQKSDNKQGSLF